jgi:UDP-glucose 4-epimerase
MTKQRIFISGIAGFLGSHLADLLISEGHHVLGADDLSGGDIANVPREADFYEYDLHDLEKNRKLTREVDVVFHAAASAYEGLSHFSPYYITHSVYSMTCSLLSAAVDNSVRRFVFCSSMSRYGEQSALPFHEDMAPLPVSPYGIAKVAAEMSLRNLARTHGMEWTVCVPHNIIGPRQRYDDPYRNVAAIMTNRMLQGKAPIVFGDGSQMRCFSPVQDTLQVFEKLALDPVAAGEVFNVGPDENLIEIKELALILAELTGCDLPPIYYDDRPGEVKIASCSSDKARRLLGYRSRTPLRESLRELVGWIRQKGPKDFDYHLDLEIKSPSTPAPWRERIY